MTEIKKLLAFRNARKKKMPHFVTRDAKKRDSVPFKWKKPRGRHSPVRQKWKGRPRLVAIGFGSPKAVKHLHLSGLEPVLFKNKNQLALLNPQTQGLVFSQTLSQKKRLELLPLALAKKFTILNIKKPEEYLKELQNEFQKRKESKKKKLTEKEEKEAEKKKRAEEKEKKEKEEKQKNKKEEAPAEEIKKEEAKEIEKNLIKKQ